MRQKEMQTLYIYYCGHEKCEPGHAFGPASRQHYLMHFILKGKGQYQVGGKCFTIYKNEAFLIKPQEITIYQADAEDPWEYVWIAFDGEEAEGLLKKYNLGAEQYVCSMNENAPIRERLYAIAECFTRGNASREELIGYFYLIFSGIRREAEEGSESYDISYFLKAEKYVRHNYSYHIHITDIARHVGVNRTYLYKIFMKHAGQSPKRYLTRYRIETAKEMLLNTKLTVTEIALSSGFHDSSGFCKAFDRAEGTSPMAFRLAAKR